MTEVNVYVDGNGRPQHLAIPNEQLQGKKNAEGDLYRTICGASPEGLSVKPIQAKEARSECNECNEQLDMWIDVNSQK